MTRIAFTHPVSDLSGSYVPGRIYEVPDAFADAMMTAGHAAIVGPTFETLSAFPTETRMDDGTPFTNI
jgi:hypothetical protein